jgi:hypothetical protein
MLFNWQLLVSDWISWIITRYVTVLVHGMRIVSLYMQSMQLYVAINHSSVFKTVEVVLEKMTKLQLGPLWRAQIFDTRTFIFAGHQHILNTYILFNTKYNVQICENIQIDTRRFQNSYFSIWCDWKKHKSVKISMFILFTITVVPHMHYTWDKLKWITYCAIVFS